MERSKILLVEDQAIIALAESRMIESHGFDVEIAHNGERALEIVEEDPELSLILMDIDLGAGIDGTETARKIIENHDLPIAFLSSHTEPEVVLKTEGITSYGYIVKDSGETVLITSIKMALRLFEARMNEKKSRAALQHSHDLMSYIIEHNRSAIAVHDRDLNYIYVSQPYLDQYNVKKRDVLGKHHYEIFPDLPEKWRIVHQKALRGEVHRGETDPYERDDGTVDWTRWECRPWYEADGTIGGIIIYTEVMSKEKRDSYELRDRLNFFQSVIRTTLDGFWVVGTDGRFLDVNDAYLEMTGYNRKEFLELSIWDIDADEKQEQTAERIHRLKANGNAVFTVRHRRKNGSIFNVELSTTYVGGENECFVCFCRDVSDVIEIK